MIGTAIFYHLVTILGDRGVSEAQAAGCFTAFAAMMALWQFLGGLLADRVPARRLVGAFGVSAAAGTGLFALAETAPAAWAALGLLGAAQGLLIAATGVLWPRFFGTRELGTIRGTVQMLGAAACATGPVIVAAARQHLGSFGGERPALWAFAALLAAAALASPLLKPPAGTAGARDV